jgi:hypothetical protein
MPKMQLSSNARTHDLGTWEIDEEHTAAPQFVVSKGDSTLHLSFINEGELMRYHKGIGMCRVLDQNNREIYITSFL